jgi:hypothetical protein
LTPFIDPRRGDIEDDASSTKSRSLLSLAGSLLTEISIPKLLVAWTLLIALPALMLGGAPIVASIWLYKLGDKLPSALAGVWPAILFLLLIVIGLFAGRQIFRLAERSFWSLNSLAIQPGYTACREAVRHLAGRLLSPKVNTVQYARLYAASAIAAGLLICGVSLLVLLLVWPSARLAGSNIAVFGTFKQLAIVALANSVVLVCGYVAAVSLVWGIADATMRPPRTRNTFSTLPPDARTWRIAHLSDVHVVGEHYGFRIESGRSGPRGNERLRRVFAELEMLHASDPLHAVLITGDMTDAGRSAEWAEFFDAVAQHPALAERMLILPGNHDLNIVDRSNPARLDLPMSPNKRLRKIRTLSAMAAVQGARVHVVDQRRRRLGRTLAEALAPSLSKIVRFADRGRPPFMRSLSETWAAAFPMVLPPDRYDGLGIILLDSNADTHFSFTNALGMITVEQARAIDIATAQYPQACWVIALHHHLVEYPRATKALFERIGTALVNGNWFVRRLQPLAGRAVLMHGHRHIDWIGECAGLPIVSAPSPVMEVTDDKPTHFYIHTLAIGSDGRLRLLQPQWVNVQGQRAPEDRASGASVVAP